MVQDKLSPTPEQLTYLDNLKTKEAELERGIAEMQGQLDAIKEQRAAAAVLFSAQHTVQRPEASSLFPIEPKEADDGKDLTAAVERIANDAPAPLSKTHVRAQLRRAGFPDNRLGNYFYTVIKRLKESKRISVQPDGKIWKSPK